MNYAGLARFILYILGALLGVFMAVWGVIHEDAALVTSGLALAGLGGIAAPNTPLTSSSGRHANGS